MKKIIIIALYFTATVHGHTKTIEHNHQYTRFNIRWTVFWESLYKEIKSIVKEAQKNLHLIPQSTLDYYLYNHEHSKKVAYVRNAENFLCEQEAVFLRNRYEYSKPHIEKLLKMPLDQNRSPRIALVCSGGGLRALYSTCGFISGLEHNGLLNAITYCSALSGSTWAVAPWVASGMSPKNFSQKLIAHLSEGINHLNDEKEISQTVDVLTTKVLAGNYISLIDIYGAIIANNVLKPFVEYPVKATFSNTHAHIINGNYPLPIYTAIASNFDPYEWIEITPFELGNVLCKHYIPTWAAGRTFSHGCSKDYSPEQPLGYYLGICGSAFSASLKDAIRIYADKVSDIKNKIPEPFAQTVKKCIKVILNSWVGKKRLFPGVLFNYTYQHIHPSNEEIFELVDAGIDFNIPLPPILGAPRNVDIIIIYDTSANIAGGEELRKAQEYAIRNNLPFPDIHYEKIDQEMISVFEGNDSNTPTVIYFPRIKNDGFDPSFNPNDCVENGYCQTFNLYYTKDQALQVYNFSRFVAQKSTDLLITTLKEVMQKKYGYCMKHLIRKEEILSMRNLLEQYRSLVHMKEHSQIDMLLENDLIEPAS